MEKNHKNSILAIVLILSVVMMMFFISAATTLEQPKANTNHTGTIALLSCQTDSAGVVNATNATFYYNFTGSPYNILVANVSNTTTSGGSFNISSVSVSGLTDVINYTFWCKVTNESAGALGQENSTLNGNTGITIDNTAPICSISVGVPTIPWKGTQQVTWSVTDALQLVSNTERVDGPQSQTNVSYSTAATTTTLLSQDTSYIGDWLVTSYGIDRAGNTCSASATFKSYLPDGVGEGMGVTPAKNYSAIAIIAVLGIAGYLIFFRKK